MDPIEPETMRGNIEGLFFRGCCCVVAIALAVVDDGAVGAGADDVAMIRLLLLFK